MATLIVLAFCVVPLVLLVGDLARNRRRRDEEHRSYGAQLKS